MSPNLARRLRLGSAACLLGYAYGRVEASYGLTPLAVFAVVAAVAWSAGYVWCWQQHASATAEAVHDRDLALARVAQLEDGGRFEPVPLEQVRRRKAMERHPSVVSKGGPA